MSRLRHRATVWAFLLAWRVLRLLPEGLAYRLFDLAADRTYAANSGSVRRLRANYARVRPELTAAELEALVAKGVRAALRYYVEAFRLPAVTGEQVDSRVRFEGGDAAAQGAPACGPARPGLPRSHGQLGPRRGLVRTSPGDRRHGGRAVGARGDVPRLPRLPREPRHGHPPGRARDLRAAARAAGDGGAGRHAPPRRPRPVGHRRRGRPVRAPRAHGRRAGSAGGGDRPAALPRHPAARAPRAHLGHGRDDPRCRRRAVGGVC
ncbi:lipid A biosynthesis lauroyl acyltransferase [Janibacter hoylei PVAS-1]|uniref:Lipid A biosynthesis lauroyl acyltransferase n=1 Tax=Janibacter hoylei PVAS-1 TaxID=1210046 RepID=K1E6E5_9MICO|nr:lipid A biosynthesis lauroyl acyltransferase [Janibacter hoylei PVAS-1]